MNNFTFYSPTCFVFGKDSESQAGSLVRRFGGTKVLIHYGGGSALRSGLIDRVKASLEAEDLPLPECGEGVLQWIPKEQVMNLPLWEGDRVFLPLLQTRQEVFSLKLVYAPGGALLETCMEES